MSVYVQCDGRNGIELFGRVWFERPCSATLYVTNDHEAQRLLLETVGWSAAGREVHYCPDHGQTVRRSWTPPYSSPLVSR